MAASPPERARSAMESFLEKYAVALLTPSAGHTPLEFGDWVFSTREIAGKYGIHTKALTSKVFPLEPGAWFYSPSPRARHVGSPALVIDQPEENLDPSSVYSELRAVLPRCGDQTPVIMVTHNANLVVNTDSDQVVVAAARRSSPKDCRTSATLQVGSRYVDPGRRLSPP